jgi:hypothetical protein
MHAHKYRVTDLAEPCLVSQDYASQNSARDRWSNEGFEHGIVDLYARRKTALETVKATERQDALDRIVVTQPFGRAFTAQPSYPPDPSADEATVAGGLAGLRRKLAGATAPARKLATS